MNNYNDYFILADNYSISAESLMQIIINSGNTFSGYGKTEKEAEENMLKNHDKSDAALFIPALFLSYHSVELFTKGLLKMNGVDFNGTHDLFYLLNRLETIYSKNSNVIKSISCFNNDFFGGLKITNKSRGSREKGQKFAVVVTLSEMNDKNRIDEFIELCKLRNWIVNNISINNMLTINAKQEEIIEFEN